MHIEGVWPVERTISAGAGCRDVPVRRGGALLLLPSTGCVWARVAVAPLRILCRVVLYGGDGPCWTEASVGKASGMEFP